MRPLSASIVSARVIVVSAKFFAFCSMTNNSHRDDGAFDGQHVERLRDATISLDFSATLTWPSTRRWLAAKAETIWMAPFAAVPPDRDCDHPSVRTNQRADSGDKVVLEVRCVESGEEVIVRRTTVEE